MLGQITGTVLQATHDGVLVTSGPFGFELVCAHTESSALLEAEGEVIVYTNLEFDSEAGTIVLLGFSTEQARNIYRALRKIHGIGRVTALAALESGHPRDTLRAVAGRDKAFLTTLPDIGPKRAAAIIDELSKMYGGALPKKLPVSLEEWIEGREALMGMGVSFDEAESRLWAEFE